MSLITVVRDVCAVVGVAAPTSVFANISTNRTMFEMLATANEMAQRIAYDTRDWQLLITYHEFVADGVTRSWEFPADYKRLLLTSNVRLSTSPSQPLRYIADHDEWLERRLTGMFDGRGEWTHVGGRFVLDSAPAADVLVSFPYLVKNCIDLGSGGAGDRFQSDGDVFRLDERLLKLGMIFEWKKNKGSPYAENMGEYSDAIAMAMGKDKPSPIYIGGQAMPSLWGNHAFY